MAKPRINSSGKVMVNGSTTREHLGSSAWIGVGAAVDWIVFRGKAVSESAVSERMDGATKVLVEALCRLNPAECEAVIEGVMSSDPAGPHALIPHGIWPNVKTAEADFRSGAFYLLLVDDVDEWGGELAGRSESFAQLRIRTDFILERWHAGMLELDPAQQLQKRPARAYAGAEVHRFLELLIAQTPDDLKPLRFDEVVSIVKSKFPHASRAFVRSHYASLRHGPVKRGPLGPKDHNRHVRIQEFRQKMISAERPK